MKHYANPMSPNSRKVAAVAQHLGIALDTKVVNIPAGETRQPEFLKINPNGKVPVLEDGNFVLWESNAICQYLCDQKPGNALLPTNPKNRADVTRWQSWELAHWDPACASLIWENLLKKGFTGQGPDPAAVKAGEDKFHTVAKVLDGHLKGREYLVGSSLTLADISVAAYLMYAQPAKIPVEGYANIKRWLANVEKLEAWKKTAPQGMNAAAE
ncbi:MAG: glutathione S-transferase family protein [Alphaproteobacteria bacterium]|nr:glutathione S-transferase family protein [Alphaproteobacteria bacterium]